MQRADRPPARGGRFRADIEGLRAVAVTSVVAYHAGAGLVSGGYVGVDVFFVISGFLITSHLYRELDRTGRIGLAAFYARRAVRLLPAAATVLAATLVGAWLWLPPLRGRTIALDTLASALYSINFRLAGQGTDYQATLAEPSPLQHFWSLAVEEQFYLCWPVLLVAASLIWLRRRGVRLAGDGAPGAGSGPVRRPNLRAIVAVLATLCALSLVCCAWQTRTAQPWAYFGSQARAWELGAGALVALSAPRLSRLHPVPAAVLGWLGLIAIGGAAVAFTAATPFPGVAALLPVGGAVAVLTAGCAGTVDTAGTVGTPGTAGTVGTPGTAGTVGTPGAGAGQATTGASTGANSGPARWGVQWLLGRRGFQAVGRLSYGWYLWHWPVLLLAPPALGHQPGPAGRLLLMLGALGLAAGSLRLVENPVRLRPRWRASARRGLALGAALTALVAVAAGLVAQRPVPAAGTGLAIDTAQVLADRRPDAERRLASLIIDSSAAREVPANLTPTLTAAVGEGPARGQCISILEATTVAATEQAGCDALGDPAAATSVVLFGDSHAHQWLPAMERIAVDRHWRLSVLTKHGCSPADALTTKPGTPNQPYTECTRWREAALAHIAQLRPAMVVISGLTYAGPPRGTTGDEDVAWASAWQTTVAAVRRTGAAVKIIKDTPYPNHDVPECLSAHLDDASACALTTAAVNHPRQRELVAAAVARSGAASIDPTGWFCQAGTCPVVIGNTLVYRDASHVTSGYAEVLAPLLAPHLALP